MCLCNTTESLLTCLFFQQVGYGATAAGKGVGLSPLQPAFSEDGGKELCYLLECIQHHPDEDVAIGPPEIPEPDFSPTVFDDIPPLPLDLFPAGGAELFGEELGDVVQGDLFNECSNEGLYEIWQNGLGQQYELDGRRMGSTIETAGRRARFLESDLWTGPTQEFRTLPVHLAPAPRGPKHYWNTVYVSTNIQAHQCGFQSAIQFVKCFGWVATKKGHSHDVGVQYRKVDNILKGFAPSDEAATKATSFHAMIQALYKLQEKGVKDIYTGKPAIPYLNESSFVNLLKRHRQEFHMALIIVNTFFLPHVPNHKDDPDFWLRMIFRPCNKRKDLVTFVDNVFTLFRNGNDKELATELLAKHDTCMRDEVNRRCANEQHRFEYEKKVEQQLLLVKRGTRQGEFASPEKNLLFCRSRTHDWVWMHSPEYSSLTLQRAKDRRKSSKKRHAGSAGE